MRLVQRWLPEPFIFAILLTFVAAFVAMPLCHQTPLEVIENLNELEGDDEEQYESILDLWPDYPTRDEDFFFNEDEY